MLVGQEGTAIGRLGTGCESAIDLFEAFTVSFFWLISINYTEYVFL